MSIDLLLNTTELFLVLACFNLLLMSFWLLRELFSPWLERRRKNHKIRPHRRAFRAFNDDDTVRVAAPW